MSLADRDKWDARYRDGAYGERRHPSALLADWLPAVPRGRALDVACGAGRNALALAAVGFEVDAIDVSTVGLGRARAAAEASGIQLNLIAADLQAPRWREALPAAAQASAGYQLIAWVRYVNDALMAQLIPLLADGGYLLTEQHLRWPEPVAGPASTRFRLPTQRLLQAASGLEVCFYREGALTDPDGRRVALAQLVARRAAPAL